jgi:quinol monooxygenase YgiN
MAVFRDPHGRWRSVSRIPSSDQPDARRQPMTELQVIARYTISAGQEDHVLALLTTLTAAVREEPGNLAFTAYRQLGEDRKVVLLERYASREALAAHRETAHFKDLVLGQIVPRLDSRVVEIYDVE